MERLHPNAAAAVPARDPRFEELKGEIFREAVSTPPTPEERVAAGKLAHGIAASRNRHKRAGTNINYQARPPVTMDGSKEQLLALARRVEAGWAQAEERRLERQLQARRTAR